MPTPINERKLANAIRVLSFDAVQKANSGHPCAPMGMAFCASPERSVLWKLRPKMKMRCTSFSSDDTSVKVSSPEAFL